MGNLRRLTKQMHRNKGGRQQNEVILRLTANVDMNDQVQVAFAKAALMRLNILHAQCSPDGVQRILGDAQIRQHYDDAKKNKERMNSHLTGSDPILRNPNFTGNPPNGSHSAVGGPHGAGSYVDREVAAEIAARRIKNDSESANKSAQAGPGASSPNIASCPVTVQKFDAPRIQWRIKKIIERRMPSPLDLRINS